MTGEFIGIGWYAIGEGRDLETRLRDDRIGKLICGGEGIDDREPLLQERETIVNVPVAIHLDGQRQRSTFPEHRELLGRQ